MDMVQCGYGSAGREGEYTAPSQFFLTSIFSSVCQNTMVAKYDGVLCKPKVIDPDLTTTFKKFVISGQIPVK